MGIAYINPMTGQLIKIKSNLSKPIGCWTPIGDISDDECEDNLFIDIITPQSTLGKAAMDTDQLVGDDFTEEDDMF